MEISLIECKYVFLFIQSSQKSPPWKLIWRSHETQDLLQGKKISNTWHNLTKTVEANKLFLEKLILFVLSNVICDQITRLSTRHLTDLID
jgi:hypothetical protein